MDSSLNMPCIILIGTWGLAPGVTDLELAPACSSNSAASGKARFAESNGVQPYPSVLFICALMVGSESMSRRVPSAWTVSECGWRRNIWRSVRPSLSPSVAETSSKESPRSGRPMVRSSESELDLNRENCWLMHATNSSAVLDHPGEKN